MPSDRPPDEMVNRGIIVNRPGQNGPGGRTFIVTGLHRSGTSLVASILRRVGIFMGSEINDNVNEDEEVVRLLLVGDIGGLRRLIADRDRNYGTWGFKYPLLHEALGARDMVLFNNPHVVVMFRDPVSVAVRNALSEYQEPMKGLRIAVDEQSAMVTFVERLECPTLLLSYEKSLAFPGDFVDSIIRFCGLPNSDPLRERLVQLIDPNRPDYIAQARRRYDGVIDGVAGGALCGWCRLTGADEPVELELFADNRPVMRFPADRFRQDLLDAGIGTGRHCFALDLRALGLMPEAVIRIKVANYGIELGNSGQCLEAYGAPAQAT